MRSLICIELAPPCPQTPDSISEHAFNSVYNTQCVYGSVSGDFVVQTGDTTGICASKAAFNNQACTAVGKKRTLSRVERRVKDRQFDPRKVRDAK